MDRMNMLQALADHLDRNEKIEAIRFVRGETGCDLLTAKNLVERFISAQTSPVILESLRQQLRSLEERNRELLARGGTMVDREALDAMRRQRDSLAQELGESRVSESETSDVERKITAYRALAHEAISHLSDDRRQRLFAIHEGLD